MCHYATKTARNQITAYVTEETARAIQRMADVRNVSVSQAASDLLRLGVAPVPRQVPLELTPAPPPPPSWSNPNSLDYDP